MVECDQFTALAWRQCGKPWPTAMMDFMDAFNADADYRPAYPRG